MCARTIEVYEELLFPEPEQTCLEPAIPIAAHA
jgi:hypothetical protein